MSTTSVEATALLISCCMAKSCPHHSVRRRRPALPVKTEHAEEGELFGMFGRLRAARGELVGLYQGRHRIVEAFGALRARRRAVRSQDSSGNSSSLLGRGVLGVHGALQILVTSAPSARLARPNYSPQITDRQADDSLHRQSPEQIDSPGEESDFMQLKACFTARACSRTSIFLHPRFWGRMPAKTRSRA